MTFFRIFCWKSIMYKTYPQSGKWFVIKCQAITFHMFFSELNYLFYFSSNAVMKCYSQGELYCNSTFIIEVCSIDIRYCGVQRRMEKNVVGSNL